MVKALLLASKSNKFAGALFVSFLAAALVMKYDCLSMTGVYPVPP